MFKHGFTLAELLIALAILGVIATFTIPKVLTAQGDIKNKAIAKEIAGAVSSAYQSFKMNNSISAGTSFGDITPYLNYVKVDTTTQIDNTPVGTPNACGTGGWNCLKMHNGAIVEYHPFLSFGGTANTNAFYYITDPDGKVTGNTRDLSLIMFVYTDGALRTHATIKDNTTDVWVTEYPNADPAWFSWN